MNFDFYFFAVGVSPIKIMVMDNMSKTYPKWTVVTDLTNTAWISGQGWKLISRCASISQNIGILELNFMVNHLLRFLGAGLWYGICVD